MKSFLMLIVLVLLTSAAGADKSIRLKVSATIPPRPCEYPRHCKPVEKATATRASVNEGAISYVGSPPKVTKKDGVLVVTF